LRGAPDWTTIDAGTSIDGRSRVQVFLSYRRSDVGGYAGRLTDALSARLGAKSVFHDVSAISPGQDFTVAVDEALDRCDAVLAVIGPGWLTAADATGARRLADQDDYVRRELSRALQRNATLVPVLVGRASLPAADDLPPDLADLAQRQAVVLHDESWHQDVDGLLRSLRGEPAGPSPRSRLLLPGAAALVLVAAIGAVSWRLHDGDGGGGSASRPPCGSTTGPGWQALELGDDPTGSVPFTGGTLTFTVRQGFWKAQHANSWRVVLQTEVANRTPDSLYQEDHYPFLVVGQRDNDLVCFDSTREPVDGNRVADGVVGYDVTCKPTGQLLLTVNGDNGSTADITVTRPTSTDC